MNAREQRGEHTHKNKHIKCEKIYRFHWLECCVCEVFSSHHKYKHKYEHSIAITLFSIILFNRIRIQAKYIKRCNLFEMRLSSVCITSWNCLALLLSGSPHFSGVLVRHPLVLYESCSHFGAIHIDILFRAHTHSHVYMSMRRNIMTINNSQVLYLYMEYPALSEYSVYILYNNSGVVVYSKECYKTYEQNQLLSMIPRHYNATNHNNKTTQLSRET